ncbi:MAG: hypothetical protein A2020_02820 [Lentisphaerae bacterium GWF2_45_14]|nr:MAG: hypothetical protein A2020_02820 [Lentisphaerae bacterium GWF2_45_14]
MNRSSISKWIRKLGLKKGDIVLLHSSIHAVGPVDGGADTVVDAFLDVIGAEGTLVVPTFGKLGIITEIISSRKGAVKSCHPLASVAAIGRKAKKICAAHWEAATGHGEDTPYVRIAEMGGYICLLGVDQDRNTTLHSIEELLRLPYLKKSREITFDTPDGQNIKKSWDFFPGPHRDFIGLDKILRESGKMKTASIGNAVIRLIKSKDMIETVVEHAKKHPDFALCTNPSCLDCTLQRAAITRNRLGKESFKTAASAALAGKYVPEMIENLHRCGIDNVELDYINGRPIQMLPSEKIKQTVSEFSSENIKTISMRLSAFPDDLSEILKTASDAGIPEFVLPFPLRGDISRFLKDAGVMKIRLSFFNNENISSGMIEKTFKDINNPDTSLSFSPAGFTRAGETPFLASFSKTRLRKLMSRIYVEDCLFDGTPTKLANGNSEIKELISILRCSSFSGIVVLGPLNRCTATLEECTSDFVSLLDSM